VCFVSLVLDVRHARPSDLEAIAGIYAEAVATPATFDIEAKPLEWWRQSLDAADAQAGRLMLVAAEGDTVLGYAKSGAHKERAAYATTVETSVYIAAQHRGKGVGNALYGQLLESLDTSGLRVAVAGVTQPNEASNRLHRAHGFTEVGTFRQVGVKLGAAWDVLWFERPLAGAAPVAEVELP